MCKKQVKGLMDMWNGRPTKAKDFEGVGGPEDKRRVYEEAKGGEDDVRGNVR